ncbi:N-acetylmuramoyl-L-alanine amidase [Pseudoruegeria sp. SK021]|uniref:N-acetylmuramoyl-L-alanine amidase n=1 Tax=Pseudoruegeria sp. SK021 TaxID=1933035 RepID=UPI000A266B7A|nr:N-acetylmuramoyl-L-alanine amidase [Pseudoruegeria sp. SK021]OSP55225.1 N-acetylmuramoyl-L-alanine amidase [Pseudoruegeria sp. SK021]
MTREGAVWHPSPNFGPRRQAVRPDLIVIHYTAMASAEAALARLCSDAHEVSAHFLIGRDGTLWQLVDDDQRAWHAGAGSWGAVTDVNSRSIGIELDNSGQTPFSAPLMARLEPLLAGLMSDWRIPPERVIGHSDMAPTRKFDPGARFDWRRLARQGVSIWPELGHGDAGQADFPTMAAAFGYPMAASQACLTAFRSRFRPWACGPEDAVDRALITALARRYPVDGGGASA